MVDRNVSLIHLQATALEKNDKLHVNGKLHHAQFHKLMNIDGCSLVAMQVSTLCGRLVELFAILKES
jgi:hypothetical protein